ncbi:MAG: DNA primase [Alphaproteobacteria bacterium]|jgi:DNA primase
MAEMWVDFALIRERADFATILARYDIVPSNLQGQITVLCPFHDDRQPSLSINLDRKLFHCFACQAKGDILDFVAKIEDISLPDAARIVAHCCGITVEGKSSACRPPPKAAAERQKSSGVTRTIQKGRQHDGKVSGCCPIALDQAHQYLFDRNLTPELIRVFGLGYCAQGRLRGRVCIPIHSPDDAEILGYSGRWANDDVPQGTPRYLMPRGFKKSALLYNYHRVVGTRHLVIVEGYWSVFRLHALNVPAVALMGTSLSDSQMDLFRQSGARQFTLLLDGDKAGRTATVDLLPRLSSLFFVHTPVLPDNESPDTIAEELLLEVVRL